ncbi:heterokaryon incompatibility protein-domain-containing protein [Pisolithus marmoratus]|nr:heterokaryon incompatibility protein-domain-containing protein [Pisolithus marmoratus]
MGQRSSLNQAISPSTLCATCAALNIKQILRDGLPEESKICLGLLPDIMDKSDRCGMCCLVSDLIRRRWRLHDFPNADLQNINFYLSSRQFVENTTDPRGRTPCHRLYIHASHRLPDIQRRLVNTGGALYLDIQLLEEDSRKLSRSRDLHGRRIEEEVDWRPSDECLPDFVRMIDVTKMALVPASPDCRYLALSYNIKTRVHPTGLDVSILPATIRDTLHLTRQIGERYLWIDALCILQDSPVDKGAQICIMDLIYSRAAFTIFAASGQSVSPGSRSVTQHIECVQGLHLTIPLPSLSEALTESNWNTRGWTFQEILLSRRRLVFTKHQMYFECAKDVWCEDVVAETKTLSSSTVMSLPNYPEASYMTVRNYLTAVAGYSQRRLTVESDIVAAITALLNVLTRNYEPTGSDPKKAFPFGMWIRHLDTSLLWQPSLHEALVRRTAADGNHPRWPSWAWTGWKGAVQYGNESQMLNGSDSDIHARPDESLVTAWHIVDQDRGTIRLDVETILASWTVPANAEQTNPQMYARSGNYASDPELEFLPPPGTLIFRTRRAHFQAIKVDDGVVNTDSAAAHAVFHVVPVDPSPQSNAGRIILPASVASPTTFEFIVLSRCDGIRGIYDELTWGERYYGCLLHVMAVQETPDDSRVKERVGIGVIVESAWMKSHEEERVMLLA